MLTRHQVGLFVDNLDQWVNHYLQLAASLESPDQAGLIHDFRTSTRRLLAVEPMLRQQAKTKKWRKQARHLIQGLNRTRDLYILQKRFAQHEQLADKLQLDIDQERRNWPQFCEWLDSFPRKRLLKSVNHYGRYLLDHKHTLEKHLVSRWQAVYQDTRQYLQMDKYGDVSVLHDLRVSYKQLRYFAELLLDAAIVSDVKHMDLKFWQDELGEIQDLKFIIDWLERNSINGALLDDVRATELARAEAFWTGRGEMLSFIDDLNTGIVSMINSAKVNRKEGGQDE